jgi:hypothetical protein
MVLTPLRRGGIAVPITISRARSAIAYLLFRKTAGSRDLSGSHFHAAKKPALALSKIARRSLPSARLKPITSR